MKRNENMIIIKILNKGAKMKYCIKYEIRIEQYDDVRNPVTDELEYCDECDMYFECTFRNKEMGNIDE